MSSYVTGCKACFQKNKDECDIMVPGEQLWYPSPSAAGDDLRWPGGLRAHAAGKMQLLP